MTAVAEVKLIAEGLEDGETYRGDCVSCGRSNTFTVTRHDGSTIVWNCFSASCHFSGSVGGVRKGLSTPTKRKQGVTPFTGELEELDESWRAYLRTKIGWDTHHLALGGAKYAPSERRIAYPIYGPMGARRGYVLRSYADDCDPRWKALTRLDVQEPHLSWYRLHPQRSQVLVVEDIPSAVRAAFYCPNVVAINGSGIGPDYVKEIHAFTRDVVWALDNDATALAVRLHRKYSLYFDSSRVLPLEKDIKNMEEEALCELLQET